MGTKIKEIWKPIPGFEDYYQASNLGRVKSIINGIKTDNRLVNLQYLDVRDNNCKSAKDSKTGFLGVHKDYTYFYTVSINRKRFKKRGFKSALDTYNARISFMKSKGLSLSKYNN